MFNNLYITIRAEGPLDSSIIDPISYILIDWGVDSSLIDWDIYPNRAKLEINIFDNDYKVYEISYNGLQSLMDLCYDYELVITIIDNNDINETYTTYLSKPKTLIFKTDYQCY